MDQDDKFSSKRKHYLPELMNSLSSNCVLRLQKYLSFQTVSALVERGLKLRSFYLLQYYSNREEAVSFRLNSLINHISQKELIEEYFHLGQLLQQCLLGKSVSFKLNFLGFTLNKLKSVHERICQRFGSGVAYSCYGEIFKTFSKGWKRGYREKLFYFFLDATRINERIKDVLKSKILNACVYARYIRVCFRKIFFDNHLPHDQAHSIFCLLKKFTNEEAAYILLIIFSPINECDEIDWIITDSTSEFSFSHKVQECLQEMNYMLNILSSKLYIEGSLNIHHIVCAIIEILCKWDDQFLILLLENFEQEILLQSLREIVKAKKDSHNLKNMLLNFKTYSFYHDHSHLNTKLLGDDAWILQAFDSEEDFLENWEQENYMQVDLSENL